MRSEREEGMGRGRSIVVTVVVGIVVIALLWAALAFWQRIQKSDREAALAGDAATAAGMLVSAQRSCTLQGMDLVVDDCAHTKGALGQGEAAQMLAVLAVGSRDNFLASCGTFHDRRFCAQMLSHAMDDSARQSSLLLGS